MTKKLKEGYIGQTLEDFISLCTSVDAIDNLIISNNKVDKYEDSIVFEGSGEDLPAELLECDFADFDCGGDSLVMNASQSDPGYDDYYDTVGDLIEDYNGDEVEIYDIVKDETIFKGYKDEVPEDISNYYIVSFDSKPVMSININCLDESLNKNKLSESIEKIGSDKFQELYDGSWYTIEGAGGSLEEWEKGFNELLEKEGIGKPIKWVEFTGKDMNDYYNLTRDNRYPDNLQFLAFPLNNLDINKLAIFKMKMKDRWFDDIVANNSARQKDWDDEEFDGSEYLDDEDDEEYLDDEDDFYEAFLNETPDEFGLPTEDELAAEEEQEKQAMAARQKDKRKEMAEKTIEELRTKLKETCEKYDTRFSGIEHLVNYYINSLKWTEKEALEYALKLFHNGTITQIKLIGKDGKEL